MTILLWLLLAQTKIPLDQIKQLNPSVGTRIELGFPMLGLCRTQQLAVQQITMVLFGHSNTDGVAWPLVDKTFTTTTLNVGSCSKNWSDMPRLLNVETTNGAVIKLPTYNPASSRLICVIVIHLNPDGKTFFQPPPLQLGTDYSITGNVVTLATALQPSDLVLVEWVEQ